MSEFFGNITAGMTLYAAANLQGKLIRLNSNTEFYSVKYNNYGTLEAGSTIMLTGLYNSTAYQTEYDIDNFVFLNDNYTVIRSKTYTQAEANKVVKQALTDDYYIMKNLLILSSPVVWNKLTTNERDIVHYLYRRLSVRQAYYNSDNTCLYQKQVANIPSSQAFDILYNYKPSNTRPVGIVMTTVAINVTVIVIAALVTAALTTCAVLVYKYWGKESSEDRALSDKTVKLLKDKGLSDSEIEQIVRETNGAVTKAEIKAKLSAGFGIAKIALIGVGAFFTYKAVKSLLHKKKSKKDVKEIKKQLPKKNKK